MTRERNNTVIELKGNYYREKGESFPREGNTQDTLFQREKER